MRRRQYTVRKRPAGGWYVIRRTDGKRVAKTNRLISAFRVARSWNA